jgi:4-oxalocrotonate tautomerase
VKGRIEMPFVNVKVVKGQVSSEQKKRLIEGLTDLIVEIMGRERRLTVIAMDELDPSNWAIGGKTLEEENINERIVSFVNIKVSKGTTNPEEMSKMMKAAKELMIDVLRNSDETNYFIIDELNSEGWGFDGISMAERGRMGL